MPELSTVNPFKKKSVNLALIGMSGAGKSYWSKKMENIGRRQLSYSINNHNKGHYLIFNIEGNATNLIDIENKIKYNESIIRHLFISVKEHDGEDSQLLIDSRNKKSELEDEDNKVKKDVEVKSDEQDEKKVVTEEESVEDNSSEPKEEESKDE